MSFPGTAYKPPYLAAVEEGYFEDAGINVENVDQPGGIPGVQALISTGANVGQFSVATAAQINQGGEDLRFFCGTLRVVQSTLLANTDSDLPSVEDGADYEEVLAALKGKTVGVQAPVGSGFQLLLQGTLEAYCATDVRYVNVGGSNAQADAALQSGAIDVAQSSPPGTQATRRPETSRRWPICRTARLSTRISTAAGSRPRRPGPTRTKTRPASSARRPARGSTSSRTWPTPTP